MRDTTCLAVLMIILPVSGAFLYVTWRSYRSLRQRLDALRVSPRSSSSRDT